MHYPVRFLPRLAALAALLLVALPAARAVAQAPQPAPPAAAAGEQDQARQLVEDMQRLQQRLTEIQQQALQDNPELQQQAEAFQQTLLEAMRAEGYEPVRSLSHIQLLEQQIQSDTLSEQERQGLVQEMREEIALLHKAEQEALQNEEVQAARQRFVAQMLAAMKAEDPQAEALMQELADKNDQLQEMVTAQAPAGQ